MTQAICFHCGAVKFGALVPCKSCGAKPMTTVDIAKSILFSDHHSTPVKLANKGAEIAAGKEVTIPSSVVEQIVPENSEEDLPLAKVPNPAKPLPHRLKTHRDRLLWILATQIRRNKIASAVFNQIKSGNVPSYALYLRAFVDEHGFQKEIEKRLTACLGFGMPLICLSGRRLHIGSARIRTDDENWEAILRSLLQHATVIFVPSPTIELNNPFVTRHKNLTKEIITLIEEKYLSRTVMVQLYTPKEQRGIENRGEDMWSREPDPVALMIERNSTLQKLALAELLTPFCKDPIILNFFGIAHVKKYYSSFVAIDPPHPSKAIELMWRINFDPEVRKKYSL